MKPSITKIAALAVLMSAAVKVSANQPEIAPRMLDAVQADLTTMTDHAPRPISLVSDSQVELMTERLRLAGVTAETHPIVFRNLRYAARHDQKHKHGWRTAPYEDENPLGYTEDIQQITSLTRNEDGDITATAYYSAVRSNLTSGLINLQIWGLGGTGQWLPLSNGTSISIDETTCSNILDLKTTVPGTDLEGDDYSSYRAILTWTVSDSFNRVLNGDLALTTSEFSKKMRVRAPRPVNGNDYIKVCMNRVDRFGQDCDYILNTEKEIVAFPLIGSVSFSGPVWAPGENPGFDPVVDIKTVKLPLGGGCELTDLEQSFWDLPNVKVDGNTIRWNITPEEFQEHQKTCFGYGDRALFSMNITAFLKDQTGQQSIVAASISNNQNLNDDPGAVKMDPMQVYYGCLAEDTRVSLADLTDTMRIQSQRLIGQSVATRPGVRPLLVAGNAYGFETKYMLEISTESERSVVLTEDHPIWVNGRFIKAIDTQLRDKVSTPTGEEIVTGLRLLSPGLEPARVWNIFLERPADAGIAPIDQRGFYANEILVGDGSVQEYQMLWEANAACRNKAPTRSPNLLAQKAGELQPVVTSALWDEATGSVVVKWTVKNENPFLFSFILTSRTGDVQTNVGEVPATQRCAEFPARSKPDEVIVTGSDGSSPTGLPSSPPTPVTAGTDSCS